MNGQLASRNRQTRVMRKYIVSIRKHQQLIDNYRRRQAERAETPQQSQHGLSIP
jgi:hypothetical protein